MSVGQLCDAHCEVKFTAREVQIFNIKNQNIATGVRDYSTGLWKIPIPISMPPPEPFFPLINGVIKRDTPISDMCEFLHASLFSPTMSTLKSALENGFLNSFPGLTLKTIRKYLPISQATSKGHLTQDKVGIMSTKIATEKIEPLQHDSAKRTMNFMVDIIEPATGKPSVTKLVGFHAFLAGASNIYLFFMTMIVIIFLQNQLKVEKQKKLFAHLIKFVIFYKLED